MGNKSEGSRSDNAQVGLKVQAYWVVRRKDTFSGQEWVGPSSVNPLTGKEVLSCIRRCQADERAVSGAPW